MVLQPDLEHARDRERLQLRPSTGRQHVAARAPSRSARRRLPRRSATPATRPMIDAGATRASGPRVGPAAGCCSIVETLRFGRRVDAVQQHRLQRRRARPSIACTSTNGATPATPGTGRARSATACQSLPAVPAGRTSVACAVSETSRLRSSPSNPFMTEMIVISAATPRQTPAIEIHEMNETKKPWRRVRT